MEIPCFYLLDYSDFSFPFFVLEAFVLFHASRLHLFYLYLTLHEQTMCTGVKVWGDTQEQRFIGGDVDVHALGFCYSLLFW